MTARVVGLHVRPERRSDPQPVASVTGRAEGGIVGDFHVAKSTRAVLVVDTSTLEDLGLTPGDLREQITITGLRGVTLLEPGTLLRIGEMTLEVSGECEPCTHIGELLGVEDREAFRISLQRRRGAVGAVVEAGIARVGDPVEAIPRARPLVSGRRHRS